MKVFVFPWSLRLPSRSLKQNLRAAFSTIPFRLKDVTSIAIRQRAFLPKRQVLRPMLLLAAGMGIGGYMMSREPGKNAGGIGKRERTSPWLIYALIGVNVAVYFAWQIPRFHNVLYKHFMSTIQGVFQEKKVHTLLTSVFSHMGGFHLGFNMLALYSIGPAVAQVMGAGPFLAFYLGAGILSGGLSGLLKIACCRFLPLAAERRISILTTPSIGASGAVLGLFAVSAKMEPSQEYYLFFIPVPISAQTLLPCMLAFDTAGLIYTMFRHSALGHGAHLFGMLFGIGFYESYLKHYNPVINYVEQLRKRQRELQERHGGSKR